MKTKEKMIEKRIYSSPEIELIKLDSEISLELQSAPPVGPDEVMNAAPEYFNNNPFKTNMA
jgi:hypothetical protein